MYENVADVHAENACHRVTVQDVPVLLTRGEFDEVSAASATQVAAALPSSGRQVATFKGAGSYMHIGEHGLEVAACMVWLFAASVHEEFW